MKLMRLRRRAELQDPRTRVHRDVAWTALPDREAWTAARSRLRIRDYSGSKIGSGPILCGTPSEVHGREHDADGSRRSRLRHWLQCVPAPEGAPRVCVAKRPAARYALGEVDNLRGGEIGNRPVWEPGRHLRRCAMAGRSTPRRRWPLVLDLQGPVADSDRLRAVIKTKRPQAR